MMALKSRNPGAYAEFDARKIVVHKTERKLSGIGTDQVHEENNLTENPSALHRWMVAGPEIANRVWKNEIDTRSALELRHCEQTEDQQKKFTGQSVIHSYVK